MTPATLEELPGVGPALKEAIARVMDEAAFLQACQDGDLTTLTQVEGLTPRRAVNLVLAARGDRVAKGFFGTPGARRIHEAVIDKLTGYASTDEGRSRLLLLHPLADQEEAAQHAQEAMAAKEEASRYDRDAIRKALAGLQRIQEPKPIYSADRLVICQDPALARKLRQDGLDRWVAVGDIEDLQQAADHEVVVFLYDEGMDLAGLDNVVELPDTTPLHRVHPPMVEAWFDANQKTLQAAARLEALLGRDGPASQALATRSDPVATGLTPNDLRAAATAIRDDLESSSKARIGALSLSGDDLLAALQNQPPPSVRQVQDDLMREGRRRLKEETGLDLDLYVAGFPITLDEDELERATSRLAGAANLDRHGREAKTAAALAPLRAAIEKEVQELLAFDARFALGCFALDHDLHPATVGPGLAFEDSVHLDLADHEASQRIAYRLGGDEASLAVLTGANSGGKSTLMEHVAQLVIMNQCGLPVVGRGVRLPWFDALHLVTANKGLDAGAFETFLRSFLPVAKAPGRKLILADEVEAMTELAAAGRILGFFLDEVAATDSMAIVVSHVAPQLLEHTTAPLRVDGIEATGLDDDHQLVVDRTPRMGHLARSTPELIVRRMAATSGDALFERLLERFQKEPAPAMPMRSEPLVVPISG
ncbi:MAG: hypothetical protein ACPGQL_01480 [Thermoplasmatota archaeon]